MAIDHALIITMILAIVTLVLMVLGQAIGQFVSVIKTILRFPKGEPEPVRLRVLAPAAVAAAVVALSLLVTFLMQ